MRRNPEILVVLALAWLVALALIVVPQRTALAQTAPKVRRVFELFDTATLANTDILPADYAPSGRAVALRITVVLGTAGVLNLQIDDGSTTIEGDLNNGGALVADTLNTFTVGCSDTFTINVHIETAGDVEYLLLEEVEGQAL